MKRRREKINVMMYLQFTDLHLTYDAQCVHKPQEAQGLEVTPRLRHYGVGSSSYPPGTRHVSQKTSRETQGFYFWHCPQSSLTSSLPSSANHHTLLHSSRWLLYSHPDIPARVGYEECTSTKCNLYVLNFFSGDYFEELAVFPRSCFCRGHLNYRSGSANHVTAVDTEFMKILPFEQKRKYIST